MKLRNGVIFIILNLHMKEYKKLSSIVISDKVKNKNQTLQFFYEVVEERRKNTLIMM